MKSKRNLLIAVAVVLAGVAATYKLVLTGDQPAPKMKVSGEVYVLPKEFLVNLADGRWARLNVALILKPGHHAAAGGGGHGAAPTPPEGYGTLPQEALVRSIVTAAVTGMSGSELTSRQGRARLKRHLMTRINADTDVAVSAVLLPDLAVQ